MSTKPTAPPAVPFKSINEVYRTIYENRGFDAQTIYRLTVTGNTELLVEMACLLLDRYPDLKPGSFPTPTPLSDNSASPSHGHQYSELKLLRYLGLNQGYVTQSIDYPPLFYALCVADHLDVVDFFRILRSRSNWTSVTFRQAWLDSEFRAFKQWFVTTMIHIPPAQYHFHFFAKLYELMFRPVIDGKGNKTHGDVMLAWIQPQILLPTPPSTDFSWAADIFGPFDATTIQSFINTYYQTVIDSCITVGNWTAFSIFISSYHFTDISTPPKQITDSPRRMTKSGQAYEGKAIVNAVNEFVAKKALNLYAGFLPQPLSSIVPANLIATGLPLPKQIREYILTARPLVFYLHLLDLKNEIIFAEKLRDNLLLENALKILNLDALREEKSASLVSMYQDVSTKVTEKTALRAQEIIPHLGSLQVQRHEIEKILQRGTGEQGEKQAELDVVNAKILSLQLEFKDLQDIASLLHDDCQSLLDEINDITETIALIRMNQRREIGQFKAKINSFELLLQDSWEFFYAFVALFGLDFAYPQDIFALQTVACMNNDLIIANILVDFEVPFAVPSGATQPVITMDSIQQFSTQLDEISDHNDTIQSQFVAAVQDKMEKDNLMIEEARDLLSSEYLTQMKPFPNNPLTLDNVIWNLNHRDHVKAIARTTVYIDGLPSLTKTHTVEQNIDFLALQLLGANLTSPLETLMKHLQKNKIILPKPPVVAAKKGEKKAAEKTGGVKTGGGKKKGGSSNPGELLSSLMGMGPAKNKSPLPDPLDDDHDDDDDFFGGVGTTIKAIGPVVDEPALGVKLRKFININDLTVETNYIAFVCATATCRPSTLRWLLQKKSKLYSNSKGPAKEKSNAFLMALLNSYAAVEYLDEMLLLLFDYCANPNSFYPVVKKAAGDDQNKEDDNKPMAKFNPGLTMEEYSSVLGHLWLKVHAPNCTNGLLQPEVMSYKVYNMFNIHYQDRSELILHTKRLAPANLNMAGPMNPMAMFGGMGGRRGDKNSMATQQWLDLIVNTCKPEFFYQTYDISIYAQQNESYVYHHQRHVVHVETKVKMEQNVDILNNFNLYYESLMSITPSELAQFPYSEYPSCLTALEKSPENGYYGYTGHCDVFDPYQRLALENDSQSSPQDHTYMKSNPFKSSFLYGFYKDICLFFTHIFFGENQHRAIIGNIGNKRLLSQLVQYAIAMRCYPVLQFFTNHGFIPDSSELSFCFYTNTASFWLADVNFEEAFFKSVKRSDFVSNFQKVIEWKSKHPDGEEIDIALQQQLDDEKRRKLVALKKIKDLEAKKQRDDELKLKVAESTTNVDGLVVVATTTPEPPVEDDTPFDPFAFDEDPLPTPEASPSPVDLGLDDEKEPDLDTEDAPEDLDKALVVATPQEGDATTTTATTTKQGKKNREQEPDPVVNIDLPPVYHSMSRETNDFAEYLKPFCLLPGSPSRRLVIQSTNPIYTQPYLDTAIVTPGFHLSYSDEQQFAMRGFQLDCDYYFQRKHHTNTKALHDLVTQFYFDDAVVRHPAVVEQLIDIVGTASRVGVPGAVEYDIKYLFKNPSKRHDEGQDSKKKKKAPTAVMEEDDPKSDYNTSFLLEAVHLVRMHQSLYHHTRSNNFSPLYQCFLTLTNAIPRLGQVLEDSLPIATWTAGSSFMAYIWSLTRSDPFNSKDFVGPVSVCGSFFMRHTGPAVTRNFDRISKMVAVYTTPGEMRIRALSTIIEENMALHTERMLSAMRQQGEIMEKIQQMNMMAQQQQGGRPNPAMMSQLMMQEGQMQQEMKQIERQMAESTIDSTSFFVILCTVFGFSYTDMTQVGLARDPKYFNAKNAVFPQSVLKNFVLNPVLMKACPHKYIFYDMNLFYRSTNSNLPFKLSTAKQQPRQMNRNLSQYQDVLLKLTREATIAAQAKGEPNPFKSLDFDQPAQTITLGQTIQPIHYIAMTLYQTFMAVLQIEQMKAGLGHEFDQRAQQCKSQKEMEQLQGEFQQMLQQIHSQERQIEASLYHEDELKIIEGIIDNSLDQNVVHQLMVEMGAEEASIDEHGNVIDPNQPQSPQPTKGGKKGKKDKGLDEYEQVENVLKNIMIARTPQTKSWITGFLSTALVATGIATVASAAFFAYKYWNGSWGGRGTDGMLAATDGDEAKSSPRGDESGQNNLVSQDDLAYNTDTDSISLSSPESVNTVALPRSAPAAAAAAAAPKPTKFKVAF